MSEVAVSASSSEHVARPRISNLGRDVILIAWDVPQAVRFTSPKLVAEDDLVSPLASLRVTRAEGGMRLFWVLRRPSEGTFEVELSTGPVGLRTDVVIESGEPIAAAAAEALFEGIDASGRVALISAFFNVWSVMFRLHRSRTFIRVLRDILRHLTPNPGPATAVAHVAEDLVLLRTVLSSGFGKVDAIYLLSDSGPARLVARAHRIASEKGAREAVHFLAERVLVPPGDAHLILIGPSGLSIRKLSVGTGLPSIERWLREYGQAAPSLREHILIEIAERSPAGRAMALEAQLRSPLQPKRAVNSLTTPSAEIVTALSTPTGTLVTGWYRDPVDLFAGIDAVGRDESIRDLTPDLHRFPVEVAGPSNGSRLPATGFAVLAPTSTGSAPLLQPRFRLRLKSGAFHPLIPRLQPADSVEARAAALRAVPPQHVDEKLLAQVMTPVIASLHEQARQRIGHPSVITIGVPVVRPKVSVIVPLYKALDFLRFQIAAFATDPWFQSNAELIYVLDSPEQAQEVEHLLGGLHLVYGLPMTFAVMERNGGYARANNVGVSLARGDVLALVNSDIIPTKAGWLEALVTRVSGRRRSIGAVGPKLLFEDGSIQHAGMYFGKDHRGRWLNQHFHKGMPRDYPPACEERIVPAVTGACIVTPRSVFEAVGGFTEDYVVGDYEDSDLCLKITMTERKIAYVPDIELYHLERQSMSLNSEYMRGIAWQYNCALHTERWSSLMTSIMQNANRQRKSRNAA
ncbi:glycosyltransferase family 2 protein [Microvirga guangxiensis]|uniref:Glycosyltransferase, GT2 family n=1 Tax=Microvirga guangxiensis TaxID=549386 RepID=A0A1G5LHL0_9HYPH|nr:glycosyltransferase [Microvirga guangxiensis]SCZ12286.1 Glycosyltransferase, GT2 family [Microvirga guangxiensis]